MFRAAVSLILCFFLILDIPNEIKSVSCESKEQKPEMSCHSHGIREQATDQHEQKESSTHTNGRSTASKPRSRAGRKHRAKT